MTSDTLKQDEAVRITGNNSEFQGVKINDKNYIHLPRHSSFTINHTFVNLGKTGHNVAESLVNTTVSTTKAHEQNGDKTKGVGRIP